MNQGPDFARVLHDHLTELVDALDHLATDTERITAWGRHSARVLLDGGRLLAAGNGGSAAHAQHFTSELVGRYHGERQPLSAIALTAEPSTVSAIVNDYGAEQMYARQVVAHGRPGDVFVGFSTSGQSRNLIVAAETARACGLHTLAVTGVAPNPLVVVSDDAIVVPHPATATVQEVHQVVVHLLCEAIDDVVLHAPVVAATA
jgi:D-sedoheptulose 7-phosphate isomerase